MARSVPVVLLLAFAACRPAESRHGSDAASVDPGAPEAGAAALPGPPPGRYVCRQHTTTMGYLTIGPGGAYEVSGVRGRYRMDPATGALEWRGGSYDEWNWEGRYEHVARGVGDGRPDEEVIRLSSDADGLRIDCFLMAE